MSTSDRLSEEQLARLERGLERYPGAYPNYPEQLSLIAEVRESRAREAGGGWIACAERLPDPVGECEEPHWCLVCDGGQVICGGLMTGRYGTYWACPEGDELDDVTHWKPWPAPPAEVNP